MGEYQKHQRATGVVPAHLQAGFDVRCEWGLAGVEALAPTSDVVVVVDVLSFTTCVAIAVANGAGVLPYRFRDETASDFAVRSGALLASSRAGGGYSLSPASLLEIPAGTRLVLPSPNGATISLAAQGVRIIAACLRNAPAVARAAAGFGARIAVIPCGERWPDGSLRPALEDWLGAGAVIASLNGSKSPEAMAAERLFAAARGELTGLVRSCASAREIIDRGFASDVELARELDCSDVVPVLMDGEFRAWV
ncbi:MAG: hypothetical protein F4Y01_00280 [Gammaproteobacteria bacterium]|nr:hypothetical protein [Gammaproteobacteria bacterium]